MKGKQYRIWIVTIIIAISAIVFPSYRLNSKINQSFEKVQLGDEIGTGEKVSWLEDEEAYRLTSLMLYGKIDASEKFIKKMTGEEFFKQFPGSALEYNTYISTFIDQKMYPHIYSKKDKNKENMILDGIPTYELYQYSENILYNYEASIWKINTELLEGTGTSILQIDQNGKILRVELYLNDSKKDLVLEVLSIKKEQIENLLKSMEYEEICVKEELSPPQNSMITQRFLVEIGDKKQQYWLDITSHERTYRMEIIALVQ